MQRSSLSLGAAVHKLLELRHCLWLPFLLTVFHFSVPWSARLHYVFSKIDIGREGSIQAKHLKAVLERLGCPSRKKLKSDKELGAMRLRSYRHHLEVPVLLLAGS
eukprot:SAG31_NODE_11268_length_1048_cov_0.977871_1_plen_105_part_00